MNLLSAKKIFEYVKDLFYASTSQNCLVLAVNFVIFIAKTPLANIADLGKYIELKNNINMEKKRRSVIILLIRSGRITGKREKLGKLSTKLWVVTLISPKLTR